VHDWIGQKILHYWSFKIFKNMLILLDIFERNTDFWHSVYDFSMFPGTEPRIEQPSYIGWRAGTTTPFFPYPAGMSLTEFSLAGNNLIILGRVWLVTSRLGTGKTKTFFNSVCLHTRFLSSIARFKFRTQNLKAGLDGGGGGCVYAFCINNNMYFFPV
jgi:hypothetical protein